MNKEEMHDLGKKCFLNDLDRIRELFENDNYDKGLIALLKIFKCVFCARVSVAPKEIREAFITAFFVALREDVISQTNDLETFKDTDNIIIANIEERG